MNLPAWRLLPYLVALGLWLVALGIAASYLAGR
jgi:hypothetical protein